MKKLMLALAIFLASATANAVPVVLVSHEITMDRGGAIAWPVLTDGSHPQTQPSTAIFDWDGSTLTSSGQYLAAYRIGVNPFGNIWWTEQITDLTISTGGTPGGTASASAYTCVDSPLIVQQLFSICGGYEYGANAVDESTTVWGPGTAFNQTIGGDDVILEVPNMISAYDFGFDGYSGVDGLSPGDLIFIGNGVLPGVVDPTLGGGVRMTFQVVPVPAAAWLFGSALGLLGWYRRRSTN